MVPDEISKVIDEALRDGAQPWMVAVIGLIISDDAPHAFSEGGERKKIRTTHFPRS